MMKNRVSAIYCIENIVNGKKYIGRAVSVYERWWTHRSNLRTKNGQENDYFQKSWNKYGEDNFKFYIIEECEEKYLHDREKYWIKFYESDKREFGYNMTQGGEGTVGFRHSEETKKKFKRKRPPEFGEKVSKAKKGKPNYERKGKKLSEESKQKMRKPKSEEAKKNMKLSQERRDRISEMNRGEGNGNYGKKFSEERRKKMSDSRLGIKKVKNPSSKYNGVSRIKKYDRWRISFRRKYYGVFNNEIEAALAWNEIAKQNGVPLERLNHIEDVGR